MLLYLILPLYIHNFPRNKKNVEWIFIWFVPWLGSKSHGNKYPPTHAKGKEIIIIPLIYSKLKFYIFLYIKKRPSNLA